jgi:outer membrane protein assembly factor BamA
MSERVGPAFPLPWEYSMMPQVWTTIVAVLLCVTPWDLLASDTRSERLQEQRLKKSQNLRPPDRSPLERFFYEFKQRRILERYQAGFMGFHPLIGGLSTGSGFAFGTQFRKTEMTDGLLDFSASAQASLAGYQKYEMGIEAPRLANEHMSLSFNFRQRNYPQEDYFGIGSDSEEKDRTSFRLEDTQYMATLRVRPARNLMLGTRGGILNTNTASGTDKRFPSIEQVFNVSTTPALDRQPDYRFGGAFAQYDNRDAPLNPRSGGIYRVEGIYYDDQDFASYSFRRLDVELQQYVPFFNQRRVIAARSRLQLTDTNPGQQVPFYLLPSLGGSEDLRGFREFRFRGKQSVVFNLEYRWEAFSGLDMAIFGDAGNVFERVDDIQLDKLETSYGFGFRFNANKSVFLRMDIGFGREGPRTFLKFNHVF